MVEDAVVDGHELAFMDACLDPVPRDDALSFLLRAFVDVRLGADAGGHEDDVRRGVFVVLGDDVRAEPAEGLGVVRRLGLRGR